MILSQGHRGQKHLLPGVRPLPNDLVKGAGDRRAAPAIRGIVVLGITRRTGLWPVMVTCRCEVLNVLSGDAARDYVNAHLTKVRIDGMGRTIHRCAATTIEWVEERTPGGYADDVTVLRRSSG